MAWERRRNGTERHEQSPVLPCHGPTGRGVRLGRAIPSPTSRPEAGRRSIQLGEDLEHPIVIERHEAVLHQAFLGFHHAAGEFPDRAERQSAKTYLLLPTPTADSHESITRFFLTGKTGTWKNPPASAGPLTCPRWDLNPGQTPYKGAALTD